MFSIIAFKSKFVTQMHCVFWVSMESVKLVSWWQVVLGAEGALVTGLGSIRSWGVLGVGCVASSQCSSSMARYLLGHLIKGLICEKATAVLNKAGVVCAGAPLGWCMVAAADRQGSRGSSVRARPSRACHVAAARPGSVCAPPRQAGFHCARQTSLFLRLTRGWTLIRASCSFMLHRTWFCFIQRAEGIMK